MIEACAPPHPAAATFTRMRGGVSPRVKPEERGEVPIHGMFFIISGLIGIMFVFR
jgi:hypothetical protein